MQSAASARGLEGPSAQVLSRDDLRSLAWRCLGLERDATRLRHLLDVLRAARRSQAPADREASEDRNLADVAWAMATSALFREESRGSHYRADFPTTDDSRFRGHSWLDAGGVRLADVDVPVGTRA